MSEGSPGIKDEQWQTTLQVLTALARSPESIPDSEALAPLVSRLAKFARKQRRAQAEPADEERARREQQSVTDQQANREHDRAVRSTTGNARTHQQREQDQKQSDASTTTLRGASLVCYTCGAKYRTVHSRYDALCPDCAEESLRQRERHCDLAGRIALVTGGRVKIGHATALRLLRNGAEVHVTSRFPRDAAARFTSQPDFVAWRERLHIHALELAQLPGVLDFTTRLCESLPHLDVLINNAAQTVRRPAGFYAEQLALEQRPANELPHAQLSLLVSTAAAITAEALPLIPSSPVLDRHGQPLDLREHNSWTARLKEVPPGELLEALLINSAAPTMLCQGLLPLLLRSPHTPRFIVNASGRDGTFTSRSKTHRHPHVNMSKAALNMLTRTSASDLARDGILMNSVDTGWVSHEGGVRVRERLHAQGWVPPLDEHDAAARLCAPVFDALDHPGQPAPHGCLFRHFKSSSW